MLGWWTIGRATGIGASALLLGLVLSAVPAEAGDLLFWLFAGAAAVAALCGASILLITAVDIVLRRRGTRIRPVRVFDLVFGAAMLLIALLQLDALTGRLPA
jgi:hypothetical protein